MIDCEYLLLKTKHKSSMFIKTMICRIVIPSKINKCPVSFLKREKKKKVEKGETLE